MHLESGASAVVFAPSPLLTVTIEPSADGDAEIHVHAGGQGFWIARMLAVLGLRVVVCGSFGGEAGFVARKLIEAEGVRVHAVPAAGGNGAYVHDRRSGTRVTLASMPARPLSRHEVDELYGAALVESLEAGVCVLAGAAGSDVVPADTYRRLAADLGANGAMVVADLSGRALDAAVAGGLAVLKVSDEELRRDGRVADVDDLDALQAAMVALVAAGAANVVVTRADRPAVALLDGELLEIGPPRLTTLDTHGAGDSLTAGIAAGLVQGATLREAVRLGAAAGALNVTRRGLATGNRDEIERFAAHVAVRPLLERAGHSARQGPLPTTRE